MSATPPLASRTHDLEDVAIRFSVDQMSSSYSMTSVQVRMALKRFPKQVLFVGLAIAIAIAELTCAGLRPSPVSLLWNGGMDESGIFDVSSRSELPFPP